MWPVYHLHIVWRVIYIQFDFAWRQHLSDRSLGPFAMVLICTL